MLTALLLAQAAAAPPAPAAAPPRRWSILVDPCAPRAGDDGRDVVVCGRAGAPSPRLPLPDEREPAATPANPDASGTGALGMQAEPCAIHGCRTGFGGPLLLAAVQGLAEAVGDLKAARARHRDPDRARRVAVDLDAPAPVGTLAP